MMRLERILKLITLCQSYWLFWRKKYLLLIWQSKSAGDTQCCWMCCVVYRIIFIHKPFDQGFPFFTDNVYISPSCLIFLRLSTTHTAHNTPGFIMSPSHILPTILVTIYGREISSERVDGRYFPSIQNITKPPNVGTPLEGGNIIRRKGFMVYGRRFCVSIDKLKADQQLLLSLYYNYSYPTVSMKLVVLWSICSFGQSFF